MDCLEELKKMDLREVSEKTHISVSEIEALIRKDFSRFNYTKAVGFTKIFKRDFNIDLSPWLKEFEEECKHESDEIFIIAKEKKKSSVSSRMFYILSFILIIFIAMIIYSATSYSNLSQTSYDNEEKIVKAKQSLVESEDNKGLESFVTTEEILGLTESNETNTSLEQTAAVVPTTDLKPKIQAKKEIKEPKKEPEKVKKDVHIKAYQNLWISVTDDDTGEKKQTTFVGEYALNERKNYTLVFGHGFFDLFNGHEIIRSRLSGIQQYAYKNGKFIKGKYIAPKPKTQDLNKSQAL